MIKKSESSRDNKNDIKVRCVTYQRIQRMLRNDNDTKWETIIAKYMILKASCR